MTNQDEFEGCQHELKQKAEQWERMPRTIDAERSAADQFYKETLMPMSRDVFCWREADKAEALSNPRYLILSVGMTYEPLVLSLALLKPQNVLFLHTEDTKKTIDQVLDCYPMRPHMYSTRQVDKSNCTYTYRAIKDIYVEWGRPKDICIDFTGGTKAMSAGLGIAGAMIDAKLIYISNDHYLRELRRPMPGHEYLEIIQNPHTVFGELAKMEVEQYFSVHQYANAEKCACEALQYVSEPSAHAELALWKSLACAYERWDAIDFAEALKAIEQAVEHTRRLRHAPQCFVGDKALERMNRQREVLLHLGGYERKYRKTNDNLGMLRDDEMCGNLMFSLYANAHRRAEQNKLDMAVLLLYRLLEIIGQRRLALMWIAADKPDYSNIPEEERKRIDDAYRSLSLAVFGKASEWDWSENTKISLLNGMMWLCAKGDELFERNIDGKRIDGAKELREMFGKVEIRNISIFAHGFWPIREGEYQKFEKFITDCFKRFCHLEGWDFAKRVQEHRFIQKLVD